jgi:E3 ubiquitin-protein ligase HERC2
VRGELQGKQVVQVATGDYHSTCVTEDGSVYTWGDNEEGQLGQEDVDDANLPVLVRTLPPMQM